MVLHSGFTCTTHKSFIPYDAIACLIAGVSYMYSICTKFQMRSQLHVEFCAVFAYILKCNMTTHLHCVI